MRKLLDILLSVKTAFVLIWAFVIVAFIGSVELPSHLAFFSGIDEEPLFKWLSENRDLVKTWWIYGLILCLAMIAINTIFCTAEALMKRLKGKNIIAKLTPQLMHIGVLLVMLGHLITASYGFRTETQLYRGQGLRLPDGQNIEILSIKEVLDEDGFAIDWTVTIKTDKGTFLSSGPLRPAKTGEYTIMAQAVEEGTTVIRVVRDPGAHWALAGGVLLCFSALLFVVSRKVI